MALYIQHGHGKSDKIETALDDGTIGGVIFGARNEKPDRLEAYVNKIRENFDGCELLLDPQFYVSTLNPPNDRYLPEYPYYSESRTASDFGGARRTRQYVKDTLDFQVALGFDRLVSPTIIFNSFSNRWHQIALNLADASLEHHASLTNPPPLLLSFVFTEEALAAGEEVNGFLDTVTQEDWDMDGFYLVVARSADGYSQRFESQYLARLLYMVHALGHINGLRVVCGYSDFVGIPLRAVGADVFATCWSQSLRQFRRKSFVKQRAGGGQARVRYSSGPLCNSILLSELQSIYEAGRLDDVLSDVFLDNMISNSPQPTEGGWTTPISQQHHWQTLHSLDARLSGRVRIDLENTVRWLRDADGLYLLLEAAGVQFDRNAGRDHLMEWVRAIAEFQRMAGFASS